MAFDSALVAGTFPVIPGAMDRASPTKLSGRRRLAILLASAVGAWLLFIALFGLIRMLVG